MATNRALVVGVSKYPAPLGALPAVAADVREIAKLLSSKDGTFSRDRVEKLIDKGASRDETLDAITRAFQAATNETVFVYLAGHGAVESGAYYFLTHDAVIGSLSTTAIPLTTVKSLFDDSPSSRVLLCLDFCHSGGILARTAEGIPNELQLIERTLRVVRGEGKVILAACTPTQSAYESPSIGHGHFTDALLRGLRGEAESHGEVTVHSLHDFIDRQIGGKLQRPMFFGHTTGRIVLMQFQSRLGAGVKKQKTPGKKTQPVATTNSSGALALLDTQFYETSGVKRQADGLIVVKIESQNSHDDAKLRALRPTSYGGSPKIPYAHQNDGSLVQVREVSSESTGELTTWTISLMPIDGPLGSLSEMSINEGGQCFSADDIAKLRASRILRNDPPPEAADSQHRSFTSLLETAIRRSGSGFDATTCPIIDVYKAFNSTSADWQRRARLMAIYALKASGTVEHVLELSIGPVRANCVQIVFRGLRKCQYHNVEPVPIEVIGECRLV